MQGCWENDIVVEKKIKRQRSDVFDIKSSFMECFKDKKADHSNLSAFLEDQHKILRKKVTNKALVQQFKDLVIETKDDSELSECLDLAMEGYLNIFMDKKAKESQAHFFPGKQSEEELINFIYNAKKTLDICVFSITNNNIANAIYLAYRDGVKVRIISDDDCMEQKGSDVVDLAKCGIPCRSDGNHNAHMHNKFCIRDNKYLLNGSFNWTVQAVKANQENIIIIENKELVNQFIDQFQMLWDSFRDSKVDVDQHTPKRFERLR